MQYSEKKEILPILTSSLHDETFFSKRWKEYLQISADNTIECFAQVLENLRDIRTPSDGAL